MAAPPLSGTVQSSVIDVLSAFDNVGVAGWSGTEAAYTYRLADSGPDSIAFTATILHE